MKAWKKYLTGILALALVIGMVSLLPHIHGEEFDENEYTFSEEETLESEIDGMNSESESESEQDGLPIVESDEPMESEITLDSGIGAIEAGPMQPAPLTLTPRELTASEAALTVELELGMCERQCTITNAEGKTLQIRNCRITDGDMEYTNAGFVVGFDTWFYNLNASSSYLLTGNFGDDGSVRIRFAFGDDLYVGFKGTGIQTVLVTPDGISVQGENMNCQLFRNAEATDHKVILSAANANQAVLLFEDGAFKGWADGAYTLKIVDIWNRSTTIASTSGTAADVCSIANAETDNPQFALVEETE